MSEIETREGQEKQLEHTYEEKRHVPFSRGGRKVEGKKLLVHLTYFSYTTRTCVGKENVISCLPTFRKKFAELARGIPGERGHSWHERTVVASLVLEIYNCW